MKRPKRAPIRLEDLILAHRHLYYCGGAVISDFDYDKLEATAIKLLPESLLVNSVGGTSNDPKIKDLASKLKRGQYKIETLIYCVF